MLLLSFRVLTTVVAGDWSTFRESLILPSAGSRPKYFTCVKETNLLLKLLYTDIHIKRYFNLHGPNKAMINDCFYLLTESVAQC